MRFFLIISLLTFILTSCQHKVDTSFPPIPDIGIDSSKFNTDITLSLKSSRNSLKINEKIVLEIYLKSDIQISSNFEISIFILENEKWMKIENYDENIPSVTILTNENLILNKQNPRFSLTLYPLIKNENREVMLLITIKGKQIPPTENNFVGSYIVLTLNP